MHLRDGIHIIDGQIVVARPNAAISDLHMKQDGTIIHMGKIVYAPDYGQEKDEDGKGCFKGTPPA